MQIFIHYLYFLFKRYIHYTRLLLDDITLYDNGMKIEDSFIPYEYMVNVSENNMVILAKYDEKDDKLIPADNLMRLDFKKKIDPSIVQNNLYYHLKYNHVSLDVLDFKSIKVNI
jgi:hypothetical protein